jgi:hypothetical protein
MPRRKPSFWQFSLVLKIEETGFRIKVAQNVTGNSSGKLNKGSNVIASEQITEKIIEINHQLKKKKIDLSTALNKLSELVGTKYGKYREERKEKQDILLQANRSKTAPRSTTTINDSSESEC